MDRYIKSRIPNNVIARIEITNHDVDLDPTKMNVSSSITLFGFELHKNCFEMMMIV